ncbi:hypothetical protein B0H14DRAFT_2584941 [Mycena olivaceomarginata]|nr:hypothetical protein B0H14DRAFT_2584941 [Mycena olivaceomarginata]
MITRFSERNLWVDEMLKTVSDEYSARKSDSLGRHEGEFERLGHSDSSFASPWIMGVVSSRAAKEKLSTSTQRAKKNARTDASLSVALIVAFLFVPDIQPSENPTAERDAIMQYILLAGNEEEGTSSAPGFPYRILP